MRLLISGSHGLIGSGLVGALQEEGHEVIRLVRHYPKPSAAEVPWDPQSDTLDRDRTEGVQAAIHLAGENLARGRWSRARKALLRNSRVRSTRLLSRVLASLKERPEVLLCASAVGYYGNRGHETLTEESAAGTGFLADLCRDWESATAAAAQAGIRVVHLRFGIVLSRQGGALQQMLRPIRLGLGGPLGAGAQYWSWITLDDALSAIRFTLLHSEMAGPVNIVSPGPVTNREFIKTLGSVLRRPTVLPAPAWALRLALGQMADEALLASTRAVPAKLLSAGFEFGFPELRSALLHSLRPK